MRKNAFVHNSDGTTTISLTQGLSTQVDTEDWEKIKHKTWHAAKGQHGAYACTQLWVNQKTKVVRMHREIMGAVEGMVVDHINHNTLDNRRRNLRICTPQQNTFNQRRKYSTIQGRKGVYFFKKTGRWYSQISLNGRNKHLGYFNTDYEAALAYDNAAKNHFGEFACLNYA